MVWNAPRRQAIPRVMLWWQFQQNFYRYLGGNSELFDAWPGHGLWTASDDDYVCEGERALDIGQGRVIEVWALEHRVLAARRQGHAYTVTVEPIDAGYQIVHLPGPGLVQSSADLAPVTATLDFVDAEGRRIDRLPKAAPWSVAPTTRVAVTVTGVVVDNAFGAQVVTLESADGEQCYIPWLDAAVVRWSDGAAAQFQDVTRGMALEIVGFRRTETASPNTLSAVRVTILDEK